MKQLFFTLTLLLMPVIFFAQERQHTATENVVVLEEPFEMPGLDRSRTVRLYLPPDYNQSKARYPVLYMHDGQNLFDYATSYVGEWEVDETLNELSKAEGFNMIVVGIDNGQALRMNEMTPFENRRIEKVEGDLYMKFIVEVVKPYIDKNYRTLSDRANTGIMGSSMGGLISHYGIYKYPETFGKAGIFSPSYWVNWDAVKSFTRENPLPKDARLYFCVGEKEGMMVGSMNAMVEFLLEQNYKKEHINAYVVPGAEHNEAQWQNEFKKAVQWLFNAQ